MLSLKTFENDEEWFVLFCNIFSLSRYIQVFVQKLMMSQTVHMTVINQEIENISGNIGLHIEEMCVNAGTISSNTCFLDCLLKKSRRTKIQGDS